LGPLVISTAACTTDTAAATGNCAAEPRSKTARLRQLADNCGVGSPTEEMVRGSLLLQAQMRG
jgi:hypothetical protein